MAIDINIPSQVKNFANLAAFPVTGAVKTIYIAEDTNKTYRWTGSAYVEISASAAAGITVGTTAITSGTVGRVMFEGAGNVVQESANLFWDNSSNILSLGSLGTNGEIAFNRASTGTAIGGIKTEASGAGVHVGGGGYVDSIVMTNGSGIRFNTYSGSGSISTERMRIFGVTGNISINTTTDAGFKFDVNGTSRFTGQVNFNSSIVLNSNNIWLGVSGGNVLLRTIQTNNLQLLNNNAGALVYLNANGTVQIGASNSINWATFSATGHTIYGTTNTNFFANGNVAINQATDSGYKLDVNGTTRFEGASLINSGLGAVATTAFQVTGSSGSLLRLRGFGDLFLEGGSPTLYVGAGGTYIGTGAAWFSSNQGTGNTFFSVIHNNSNVAIRALSNSNVLLNPTAGNVLIGTTTDAGFKLDINGTARVATSILVGAGSTQGTMQTGVFRGTYFNDYANNFTIFQVQSNGNASFYQGLAIGTSANAVASAQVEIVSTTKGFLPPRMTTTQVNAIATPAEGLVVYNTTISHFCVYQAGSWVRINHSPM